MNRKKAILLLTAFESMLLAILCMLYFRRVISTNMFIGIVFTVSVFCSAFVILLIKKMNQ